MNREGTQVRRRLPSTSRSALTHWLVGLAATLLLTASAAAVIIETGDGTGNTSAPVGDDPGFGYVGVAGGATGVYLRNGWVLTANHVATGGTFLLDGVQYTEIPGSATRISNGDGTWADLKVFQLSVDPGLPALAIRDNPALPSGVVYMIGRGTDRGASTDSDDPTVWTNPPPPLPSPPIEGFKWAGTRTVRWGTNIVEGEYPYASLGTYNIYTTFDPPPDTSDESQGANGDSGGAVFAVDEGVWELAGIMLYVANYPGQFGNTSSLYANDTISADLSYYRQEILAATAVPEPSGRLMLAAGAVFLAVIGRGRIRP
ncbi:MAG: hypothetical protein ACE5FL_00825 [Myxococcota bacterium]